MTIFEPVGNAPATAMRPGFVPCEAEGAIAGQLLRPQFDDDRESLLLAAFDAFERLVRFESIDSETPRRCLLT